MCSGEMWSGKFKKYVKFLSLPNNLLGETINKKIDSIWKMRNDIAHANINILYLIQHFPLQRKLINYHYRNGKQQMLHYFTENKCM